MTNCTCFECASVREYAEEPPPMTAPQITRQEYEAIAAAMGMEFIWDETLNRLIPIVNGHPQHHFHPATSNDDCAGVEEFFLIDILWEFGPPFLPNGGRTALVTAKLHGTVFYTEVIANHQNKGSARRYAACKVAAMAAQQMTKEKQG